MDRTAEKWYRAERARLAERRADVDARLLEYHAKLTDAIRERALLDDVDMRLSMHLPETDYEIVEAVPSLALSVSPALPPTGRAAGGER